MNETPYLIEEKLIALFQVFRIDPKVLFAGSIMSIAPPLGLLWIPHTFDSMRTGATQPIHATVHLARQERLV